MGNSLRASSHFAFAMIFFDVCRYLSSLGVNGTIENSGSKCIASAKANANARWVWVLSCSHKYKICT